MSKIILKKYYDHDQLILTNDDYNDNDNNIIYTLNNLPNNLRWGHKFINIYNKTDFKIICCLNEIFKEVL